MKKIIIRITVAVCAIAILLSSAVFPPVSVSALTIPTDASVYERVSTIYRDAIEFNYQRSGQRVSNFTGYCSHYVHLQLMLLGVNTSYIGVNGNGAYNKYENLAYSTGGKKIHAYPSSGTNPISRILKTISSTCPVATNIMLGFHSTSTASGKKYGHAMLIHAIINGYVYFTDNFAMRIGGTYYNQGDPIKCTIAEFDAFYGRPSVFSFEGIIWFETEELTAAVLSGNTSYDPVDNTGADQTTTPPNPEVQPIVYTPGVYTVNYAAGLRIRSQSNTNSSTLEVIPDRFRVYVTEVENGFGKIFCNYNGKNYTGWVYLALTERVGDLPVIYADTYNGSGAVIAREWFESLEDAMENAAATAKLNLIGDCTISRDIEVGPLREIRLGSFNIIPSSGARILIRGGTVTSSTRNTYIESDPLLKRTSITGGFSYTCPYTVSLSSTSISIGNNPEIVFIGETNAPSTGVEYLIECEGFNGETRTFSGTLSNGRLTFKTDGIPVKRFADSFKVRAVIRSKSDHSYYISSDTVSFNPAEHLGGYYSKNPGFDRLLVSLLNYSAAAQTLFNSQVSSDALANRFIPMSERSSSFVPSQAVKALDAPAAAATGDLAFTSYALDFSTGDRLSIVLKSSSAASDVRLLVFSHAEYLKLKKANPNKSDSQLLTPANCNTVLTHDGNGTFRFSGFTAKQYADTYYCRLVKGNGTVYSAAESFSVTKYCERMINDGIKDKTDDLCRALCEYSAAARDYFGYTVNSK